MNQTSYLSLFVITGLLIGGITPGTLAFADEDKLELEIEKEDGLTKIEIRTGDKEVKLELEETDNEFIVDTILQYVDLPDDVIHKILSLDDSEFEFEYEYKNEFDKYEKYDEEYDYEHDDDKDDEDHDYDDDHYDDHDKSNEFEALEAIEDAIHEVEEATMRLQDAYDQGFDISHAEDLAEEARIILGDEYFDDDYDKFEDHEFDEYHHENEFLEERIHELERENQELREQIVQLE